MKILVRILSIGVICSLGFVGNTYSASGDLECYYMWPHMDCGDASMQTCLKQMKTDEANMGGFTQDFLIGRIVTILDTLNINELEEHKLLQIREKASRTSNLLGEELRIEPTNGGAFKSFNADSPHLTSYFVAITVARYITEYVGDDCIVGEKEREGLTVSENEGICGEKRMCMR